MPSARPRLGADDPRADGGDGRSRRKAGDGVEYAVVCDLPTLIWAANLATIEFHVPLWRVGAGDPLPGPPDHLVFDLDPGPGTSIVECCRVAVWIRRRLAAEHLQPLPKTSGSKGLQLYVPLDDRVEWDTLRDRSRDFAQAVERDHPDLVVMNMRRELRKSKVLIDWSQNSPSKTTVAAYSLRARPEPTVSTPLTWDEVEECERRGDPDRLRFLSSDVLERVERHGDLFSPLNR